MKKLEPLKLLDLDLLNKPKEEPVQEVTPVEEILEVQAVEIVHEPKQTKTYVLPKYKDLGDLTQEEWQDIFGKGCKM